MPATIGLAAGGDPAWMLDGDNGHFSLEGAKTLWIFRAHGSVRVRGRELTSGAVARFQLHGIDGPITSEMVLEDLSRESVLPGGAPRSILETYSFIPSYVFYPQRGCYEFEISLDGRAPRIVVQMK